MTNPSESCCEAPVHLESAIDFHANMRPHVSVNVPELTGVRPFYTALFGSDPVKEVFDYLKWELASPPVNFTLNQHPPELASCEDLGIEVENSEQARNIAHRLQAIGVEVAQTGSSYFAQDLYGNRWEIMVRNTDL